MADDHRTDLPGKSLHSVLKAKSRRRREELAELAANSLAPRRIRNDLMPKLELVERAPGALRFPARKLRKVEPAHVLEVANAISVTVRVPYRNHPLTRRSFATAHSSSRGRLHSMFTT